MAADSKSKGITLSLEEATMIRLVLKHAYKSQSLGYNIEPSGKQSNAMIVSKAERKMLDKLLGPNLKTIDKNKVSSLTLNKCAYALSGKMGGSVEYEDDEYEEEDLCHDYFTSCGNNVKK
jgi:hypothetical protein